MSNFYNNVLLQLLHKYFYFKFKLYKENMFFFVIKKKKSFELNSE